MKSVLMAILLLTSTSAFAENDSQLLRVLNKKAEVLFEARLETPYYNHTCIARAQERISKTTILSCGEMEVELHWLATPAMVLQNGKTYLAGTVGLSFTPDVNEEYGSSQPDLFAISPTRQTYEKVFSNKGVDTKLKLRVIAIVE